MTNVPIAVIGMGCRFPRCWSPQEFWEALRDERTLVSEFSSEQLRAAGTSDELLADEHFVRSYGFLDNTDQFDPNFFGILKRDADILDPQHRIFLECCVLALHDAGLDVRLPKNRTGVFAGCLISNYLQLIRQNRGFYFADTDEFLLELANDKDFLPLRASYLLGLGGPSININAGCATSLVAVHVACQSLRANECDVALAGAASIRHYKPTGYLYREGGILSPDGKCRPFDADARGTVFGDGVACIVLKRLDDALRDGNRVYGLVLGSAVNNDGRDRPSFVAPSVSGQTEVIAAAYKTAGINPETVSYIEAHGTGTSLGDRVEFQALTTAFRRFTKKKAFCGLGSVKSNCGHLDAAAGMAGLIKILLAFTHDGVPATLNHRSPNPLIDFHSSPFELVSQFTSWPRGASPRRAGISSFGMGGVNAHMILQEPPVGVSNHQTEIRPPVQFNRVRCVSGSDGFDSDVEVGSWLYKSHWREQTSTPEVASPEGERYVFLGVENELATTLMEELEGTGHATMAIEKSLESDRELEADRIISQIENLARPSATQRLNIIDFRFANCHHPTGTTMEESARLTYIRALSILQQVGKRFPAERLRIVFVTAGSLQVLPSEVPDPVLATILGPILVAPQEHPNLLTCNVDIPAVVSPDEINQVVHLLKNVVLTNERDRLIAIRGAKTYVQDFFPVKKPSGTLIQEGGVYLVVGGLGTIGPVISQAMLAAGARRVVLTRRSPLTDTPASSLSAESNSPVSHASVDITDLDSISKLVDEIYSVFGRLDGIVHAAAVPGWETFEFIAQASDENFRRQAGPKILGTINLSKILAKRPETFCLFLTSLACQLGGLGFSAYSAVSNFVDAFVVRQRTQFGLPWMSVNLDNWTIADNSESRELFASASSIPRITPEEGERLFSLLFSSSDYDDVIVSKQPLNERMSRLSLLKDKTSLSTITVDRPYTCEADVTRSLLDLVRGILEVEHIDGRQAFQDLGGDSLQTIELLEVVQRSYGVNLQIFELLNARNLNDLASTIWQRFDGSLAASPAPSAKTSNEQVIVSLRRSAALPTLFLIHPHGGGVSCYRSLVNELKYSATICGIRIPGLYGECDPPQNVEHMAETYKKAIVEQQPLGPYLIAGFSAGGLIAFEVCKQLQEEGHSIQQLIMIDTLAPHHLSQLSQTEVIDEAAFLSEVFLGMIDLPLAKLRALPEREARELAINEWKRAGLVSASFSVDKLVPIRRIFDFGVRAYPAYMPRTTAFERVLLIKCNEQPPEDPYQENDLGWGRYVEGNLVIQHVEGNHAQLLSGKYVTKLAQQIDMELQGEGDRKAG